MSAKKKTVLKGFDYMHCDDFAKYLMDMAAKGWHFKEWGIGLKFEKGEPEQAVYAVEVFAKASEDDTRPAPETKEFAEYCEVAGWQLIDGKQKFCIFKKVSEDSVELFTPEERVANSFKASVSGHTIALLILYGFNVLLQWWNLDISFEQKIFSGLFLIAFTIWHEMFFGQLWTILYAFWKKIKYKKDIKSGKELYIGNTKGQKIHFNMRDGYGIVLLILLTFYFYYIGKTEYIIYNVVIFGLTIGLAILINKLRPDREDNIMIQIGFGVGMLLAFMLFSVIVMSVDEEDTAINQDKLPLVISDYREYDDKIKSTDYYNDRNMFGSFDIYFIFGEEESIHYEIYTSENEKILDRVWEEVVVAKKVNKDKITDCTADWGAQKALRNRWGNYYVRYENKILVFSDDESVYLTVEQINIIRDKLDLR